MASFSIRICFFADLNSALDTFGAVGEAEGLICVVCELGEEDPELEPHAVSKILSVIAVTGNFDFMFIGTV